MTYFKCKKKKKLGLYYFKILVLRYGDSVINENFPFIIVVQKFPLINILHDLFYIQFSHLYIIF